MPFPCLEYQKLLELPNNSRNEKKCFETLNIYQICWGTGLASRSVLTPLSRFWLHLGKCLGLCLGPRMKTTTMVGPTSDHHPQQLCTQAPCSNTTLVLHTENNQQNIVWVLWLQILSCSADPMGHNSNFSELAYHSYERTLKKAELGKHMSDSEMYKKGKKIIMTWLSSFLETEKSSCSSYSNFNFVRRRGKPKNNQYTIEKKENICP